MQWSHCACALRGGGDKRRTTPLWRIVCTDGPGGPLSANESLRRCSWAATPPPAGPTASLCPSLSGQAVIAVGKHQQGDGALHRPPQRSRGFLSRVCTLVPLPQAKTFGTSWLRACSGLSSNIMCFGSSPHRQAPRGSLVHIFRRFS